MNPGDRVSDYIVERELGEGGMAKVYLARHSVVNQQVAVKVLDPEIARKPGVKERFIQEANIQLKLNHPGIVRALTATQISDGSLAIVMDYINGKSLAETLALRGTLPIDDVLKIMEQVLSAVGYAHQQHVIHRDLKPSNVMVTGAGNAKVTDFGIAKVLGSTRRTSTGAVLGSAHYMSPEQIRRPETVDARSDIYSLGCVFYEMLTGHPPFGDKYASDTESDFEIKMAHINKNAPGFQMLGISVPTWLGQLVMTSLQKDPDRRQQSCESILRQIKEANRPSTAPPKGGAITKFVKKIRRFGNLGLGLSAGAVVSIFFLYLTFNPEKKEALQLENPSQDEPPYVVENDKALRCQSMSYEWLDIQREIIDQCSNNSASIAIGTSDSTGMNSKCQDLMKKAEGAKTDMDGACETEPKQ